METENLNNVLSTFLTENPWLIPVLIIVTILKGFALWQSSQKRQKIWFIALLIVNSFGVLEIIYLIMAYISKRNSKINPQAPDRFESPQNPNLP